MYVCFSYLGSFGVFRTSSFYFIIKFPSPQIRAYVGTVAVEERIRVASQGAVALFAASSPIDGIH